MHKYSNDEKSVLGFSSPLKKLAEFVVDPPFCRKPVKNTQNMNYITCLNLSIQILGIVIAKVNLPSSLI